MIRGSSSSTVSVALLMLVGQAMSEPCRADDPTPSELSSGDAGMREAALPLESALSRDEWKQRIEEGRKRSDLARREWRKNGPPPGIQSESPERIASQRILSDDTLQAGDVVSTDKGLFLFRGRSGLDGQAPEFVPLGRTPN